MAASDAKPVPIKNTAYRVTFPIFDADGDPVAGATGLDSEVSKDGGTFADCTNEATEIATSSGIYYLDLTSTEMNADTVAIQVKTTSTGAKTTVLVLYPQETGDIKVDVQSYGGTAGTFASGRPEVNATHWGGTAVASATVAANVTQISGDSTAADNLEAACDGTGYNLGNGAIVAASVSGDVGGSVLGNVNGSVGSVSVGVTISGSITTLDGLDSALTSAHGSGSWATATGFSTHSAADVWAVGTRELTSGAAPSVSDIWSHGTRTLTADPGDSAATIADAVWDELLSGHTTAGSAGKALSDAGAAGDPWATSLPGAYSAGSAGYIVGTNLNATVGSRSSHSAADVWSVATRVLTAGTNIVLAKGVGVTGFNDISAAQVNAEADAALSDVGLTSTVTGRIDAAISTRLASASYTAPLDAAGVRAALGLASANLDTQLAAIVADTGELQTDWANGGRLDVILDARASQTSVDDLPTNAELAAALPANFAAMGINASGHVSRVTLADTLTTYTGNTPQTGDAYAVVNSGTHGNAALKTLIDTIDSVVDAILADTGTDGVALAAATLNKIADHMLRRQMANVEASSDGDALSVASLYGAIQQGQESSISGTTQTVRKTDGTTLGTKTLTKTPGDDPIRGIT